LGKGTFRISPYPFSSDEIELTVPGRRIPRRAYPNQDALRAAFAEAPIEELTLRVVR
jgi:hypothetical protein